MKRTPCYNCVRKHLAQAKVLAAEMFLGYPEHAELAHGHMLAAADCVRYWTAMGHMAEASDEIVAADFGFANRIRNIRLAWQENPNDVPDFDALILESLKLEQEIPDTKTG